MKKSLFLVILFIVVIIGALIAYFAFTPNVQSDPLDGDYAADVLPASGEEAGNGQSFEESFYQDLSALFDGETNGYEDIQGEYGFVTL